MDFRIKCALQHVFSLIPRGEKLNYFFQKNISRSLPASDEEFINKVNEAYRHFNNFKQYNSLSISGSTYFEFGAGWDLIGPICMSLLGFKNLTCIDIVSLANEELIKDALFKFNKNKEKLPFTISKTIQTNTKSSILKLLKSEFGINYTAPADARKTSLADNTIDFISSSSTFEHIPYKDIPEILKECYRILKNGGVFSININYRDHWAQFDKNISIYNFLKYSAFEWKLYNPALHYQNRLRHPDYVGLIKESGFTIALEEKAGPTQQETEALKALKLNTHIKNNYSLHDLAIKGTNFVLIKG